MRYFLLFLVFIFSATVFGKDEFLYFRNEKYETVRIEVVAGHKFINCKKKNCEALRFLNAKPVERTSNATPEAGHPAARYCWDAGAENRILKENNPARAESDFCLFKDGSMVDAWDLYLKHYPATDKKLGK